MKTECGAINPKLQEYIDNELAPNERDEVQAHIAQCESCRKEVLQLEKLGAIFRKEFQQEEVPPVLLVNTWKAIEDSAKNYSVFDFLFTRKGLAWSLGMYVVGLFVIAMGYFMAPIDRDFHYDKAKCPAVKICQIENSVNISGPSFKNF